VPAPRVFPREPKSLLQANITIDHRSQITEREREGGIEQVIESDDETNHRSQITEREKITGHREQITEERKRERADHRKRERERERKGMGKTERNRERKTVRKTQLNVGSYSLDQDRVMSWLVQ